MTNRAERRRRAKQAKTTGGAEPTVQQVFQAAVGDHRGGRFEQAGIGYERVLKAQPNHADARHLLGVIAHQLGRDEISVEMIGEAIRINPGMADYHCNFGNALRGLGRFDAAVAAYETALAIQPDDADTLNNLGNVLKELGRPEAAAERYRAALALNAGYAEAHNNLGVIEREQGRLAVAVACFREAMRLKPDYPDPWINLGGVVLDLGDADEAAGHFREALRLRPDFAEAHNNLATVLQGQGAFQEAIGHYRRAVEIKPDFHHALYNLGYLLEEVGKSRDAVAVYQNAFAARSGILPAEQSDGREQVFPGTVSLFLELTNKCNFHCEFCPSDSQQRAIGFMDEGLARRMYDEVAERGLATQVMLHLMGEPTLHPKLYDILAYGGDRGIRTELVTNGSALVAKTIPRLLDNLNGTVIASLMTPTRDSYAVRGDVGLKWERYTDNFRLLVREHLSRLAESRPIHYQIAIRIMVTKDSKGRVNILETPAEIGAIWDEWSAMVAEFETDLGLDAFARPNLDPDSVMNAARVGSHSKYPLQRGLELSFWSAFTFANTRVGDEFELRESPEQVSRFCKHPFLDVGVLWNGDVTLCCMDYDAQLVVGNVNDASLETVLLSDAAAALRESMFSLHTLPPFCRQCQARPMLPGEDSGDASVTSTEQRGH